MCSWARPTGRPSGHFSTARGAFLRLVLPPAFCDALLPTADREREMALGIATETEYPLLDTNSRLGFEFYRVPIRQGGIAVDRDKILVNDFYQTNLPGYYAIGDVTQGQALAHVASAEGILCVEKIAGLHVEPLDYGNVPGCTYCSPEIASVGLTEAQAIEKGYEIKVGKFPFSASGKAQAGGNSDGFVKVIFDAKYGEWLGCHMIGAGVTDMIAEAVLGRKLETTGHEVLKAVHPHPTMSEAVMEAVADAYDEVIHL